MVIRMAIFRMKIYKILKNGNKIKPIYMLIR